MGLKKKKRRCGKIRDAVKHNKIKLIFFWFEIWKNNVSIYELCMSLMNKLWLAKV